MIDTSVVSADAIHPKIRHVEPVLLRQRLKCVQHGVMFRLRRDDVPPLAHLRASEALHGQVAAFRAAAGEDDLARLHLQPRGDRVPRGVDLPPRPPALRVQARRIA
jgi:hypothetical protein